MTSELRVALLGQGFMGKAHSNAFCQAGHFYDLPYTLRRTLLCGRDPASLDRMAARWGWEETATDWRAAIDRPDIDIVDIALPNHLHAPAAIAAAEAGKIVFCEKPLAMTVEEAQAIVDAATASKRKLVIGYILRVHPAWIKFIEIARTLGKPLVMRMNLNQQSHGPAWNWHRNLMDSMSPIVDCGVHYVDVMCQMTGAKPTRVCAVGARLTDDIKAGMYNYGQLQVTFDDGSVGWYEAGWGPMMSEVAFFVKDVVGPKGCVSIVKDPNEAAAAGSDDIDSHTKTNCIRVHYSDIDAKNEFVKPDQFLSTEDEPDHQALCDREQAYLLRAIQQDLDLSDHMQDAVNSLRIVLAADESVRSGQVVAL